MFDDVEDLKRHGEEVAIQLVEDVRRQLPINVERLDMFG